jgi:hypothetical protein
MRGSLSEIIREDDFPNKSKILSQIGEPDTSYWVSSNCGSIEIFFYICGNWAVTIDFDSLGNFNSTGGMVTEAIDKDNKYGCAH